MANVHDVAAYILKKIGKPVTAMKLEKLAYYCQAWSLVWDERVLFSERVEAWANGPVCPALYRLHRGEFLIHRWTFGESGQLDQQAKETVDAVLGFYGDKTPQWLSDLTHAEDPWRQARARAGATPGEWCTQEITLEDMAEYYGSIGITA